MKIESLEIENFNSIARRNYFVDLSYAVFVYGARIPKIFLIQTANLIRHGV